MISLKDIMGKLDAILTMTKKYGVQDVELSTFEFKEGALCFILNTEDTKNVSPGVESILEYELTTMLNCAVSVLPENEIGDLYRSSVKEKSASIKDRAALGKLFVSNWEEIAFDKPDDSIAYQRFLAKAANLKAFFLTDKKVSAKTEANNVQNVSSKPFTPSLVKDKQPVIEPEVETFAKQEVSKKYSAAKE